MSNYKAPLRDMRFAIHEVLDHSAHCARLPGFEEVNRELLDAILEECAKFAENELVPLNSVGDSEGCQWKDGEVTTPTGFKEAYAKYVDGGWAGLSTSAEYGGQGLPPSLGNMVSEISGSANWAWAMYPGLSHGAQHTLAEHGSDEQKKRFLGPLSSGIWTGTMCLTEPHCGTDLGMLRTKAEPQEDGSYAITGTKIFISAGEHDLAQNIVHIVLARLPDAPKGTKGISLFIVPKFNVNPDGSVGERNSLECGAIEHKMGIHGNATCVMNFDAAKGFLIGPPNRGLNCMFTFMNAARVGTAIQGLAHTEWGFQHSLAYAKDRLQMRALGGAKAPDKAADPIIVHPDVRRMLLTQKAFAEGGRLLIYHLAQQVDISSHSNKNHERKAADSTLALLTPIAKAFLTETGFESANLGMQVFGGHGFIKEWGMEQNVRDARIAMLYEGTTGIQALDLLGRKVVGSQGSMLRPFLQEVRAFCREHQADKSLSQTTATLLDLCDEWEMCTTNINQRAMQNADEIGAASVDYLMYSGYVVLAYLWARAAVVARAALADDEKAAEADFYRAKLHTCDFYFQRLLPRTRSHLATMQAGAESLMNLHSDHFAF